MDDIEYEKALGVKKELKIVVIGNSVMSYFWSKIG